MKSTLTFLCFISLFKNFFVQAAEFSFGGLNDDEEERIFNITFGTKVVGLKSEMQFLSVVCIILQSGKSGSRTQWQVHNHNAGALNNSIFIKSLQSENETRHSCSMENYNGTDSLQLRNLTVTVPTIPIERVANLTVQVGGNVLRRCIQFQLTNFENSRLWELLLQNDYIIGNYFCKFKSKELTDFYEANSLAVHDGILKNTPSLLKVREGQKVEFECQAVSIHGVKNINVRWRYQSEDGTVKYTIPDSRWSYRNAGFNEQTSFISLNVSQVLDSGYYICYEPNGRISLSELIVIPEATFLTMIPKEIHARPSQKIDIDCHTKDARGRPTGFPQFHFIDKSHIKRHSRFIISQVEPGHIRLSAPSGLSLSDNNMTVHCTSRDLNVTVTIYVNVNCPPGYLYCQNGHCLETSKFYDNVVDCADRSDEIPISQNRGWSSNVLPINHLLWLSIGLIIISQ